MNLTRTCIVLFGLAAVFGDPATAAARPPSAAVKQMDAHLATAQTESAASQHALEQRLSRVRAWAGGIGGRLGSAVRKGAARARGIAAPAPPTSPAPVAAGEEFGPTPAAGPPPGASSR